jgi:hypothetical protein
MNVTRYSGPILFLIVAACDGGPNRSPLPPQADASVPSPASGLPNASPEEPTTPAEDSKTPPRAVEEDAGPPACKSEQEPNDDAAKATEFSTCITGELNGWTDVDSLAITAPTGVTHMLVEHIESKGPIRYAVTVRQTAGSSSTSNFNMTFTDQAPRTKITPGETYLFSLKWDNNGQGDVKTPRPYAIKVTFE